MRDEPAMLRSTTGETMALEGVEARGRVRGLLLELDVEQRYRNPHATNIEAVYTFPLPTDAVLLDLEIALGDRRLVAAVVEKKAAERDYEQAIDKGDTAIMLERAGDGLCTLNLGNLMAGEAATIRYRYAQLLRFEQGSVRLTIPTVIAPRYGDPKAAGLAPHQVPTSDLAIAYPFALSIDLEGEIAAGKLSSPSHALAIAATATGMHVGLARGAFLDRDFVLSVGGLSGRTLAVVAKDGDRYVALASFCADVPRDAAQLPLTLKLLVDCSGSMGGDSIAAARRALHRILASLESADRFSFSRFGSSAVHETRGLVAADERAVRDAAQRIGRMDADLGGTEMAGALQQVFAIGGRDGASDVLLLTDGEVWDADHLIAEARSARQRVFVVGIGSAPAEGVLRRLAEATGGACEFVAPNEDAEAAILRMFGRMRAPRVERADVAWPAAPAWSTPLPSGLFGGETVHAFAGFDAPPLGAVALALRAKNGSPPLTAAAQLGAEIAGERTLARIAASRRIESASEEQKLRLALDYGLLTPRTNLLVVHERAAGEKAADLPKLAHVAQMHAAGWHGVGSVDRRVESVCYDWPDMPARRSPVPEFADFESAHKAPPEALFDAHKAHEAMILDIVRSVFGSRADDGAASSGSHVETVTAGWIAPFLRRLETSGGAFPATFDDLARLGVPAAVLDELRAKVGAGVSERDVVDALLEAFAIREESSPGHAVLTRHVRRALRRFATAGEHAGLRTAVRELVDGWCAAPARRGADIPF